MSNEDKCIYINRQRERYKDFQTRKGKSLLITEVAAYLKITRDHAIELSRIKGPVRSGPLLQKQKNRGSLIGL